MNLYEIKAEWQGLYERLRSLDIDEQTVADTIEGSDIQAALEKKAEAYEIIARNLEASVPAIDVEIKRLQALKKSATTKAAALRGRLLETMIDLGVKDIEGSLFKIGVRKSPPFVVITDESAVPDELMRIKKEPNKTAIKEALIDGDGDLPWAHLESKPRLQVK